MAGVDDKADEAGRRPIPFIDPELVEWLEATHPNKVIQPGESYEQAVRRGGFQDCIELLKFKMGQQQVAASLDPDQRDELSDDLTYEVPDPDQPLIAIRIGGSGRRVFRSTSRTERP